MSKITAYSPDTTPSLDDLIVTVDIGNGNKKVTLQDLADAIAPSIGTTLESNGGWVEETELPDTITYDGNGSYSLVFNSTDLTDTLSEGMRLRFTRTVSSQAQCADLEASSTQYFNDTSVSGTTFTDDFVCGAWIKLESIGTQQYIVSRWNGTSGWGFRVETTGQITLFGTNASGVNYSWVQSYQSVPVGKWYHVSAQLDMSAFTATTTTSYIMFNGKDVPASVARGGTNPTALVQAGNLEIGATNSGVTPFDGKLAQVFYSSAKITQANVQTLISQGLTASLISTHAIVSAYSFDNSINDLNTTTANNLSAQNSAAATNVDSPFGNYLGGTYEYAIISAKPTFSTNTTATVQVPEGCAIPTSGGVSAVAYSTQDTPYLFPKDTAQWTIQTTVRTDDIQNSPTSGTWYNIGPTSGVNGGESLNIPTGKWEHGYECNLYAGRAGSANGLGCLGTLSTTNSSESDPEMTSRVYLAVNSAVDSSIAGPATRRKNISLSSPATYYLNVKTVTASGTNLKTNPDATSVIKIFAKFNLL